MGGQGEVLKSSVARSFKVALHPPLRAPASEKVRPVSNAVVDYQNVPGGVTASWSPIDGAVAYDVSVRLRSPAGTKPIFQKRVATPGVAIGEIPEGDYLWSITAIDILGRPGEALTPRGLKTTYGVELGAPTFQTKEVQ